MRHDGDGVSPGFKELSRPEQRANLLKRLRGQKAGIAQLIQDVESWNDNNPWGESIDVERYGLYAKNAETDAMLKKLMTDA